MGFKIATFQHVLEGYKVAKEIAAHGAGASTFSDWWGYKIEAADAIPYNAAHHDAQGRARLDQLRRRRAGAAAEHRSGQGGPLRRGDRRRGARDGHDQSRRSSSGSTTASARSKSARTPTSSSGTTIRSAPYAIVERVYIDGIAYYDREKDCSASPTFRRRRAALDDGCVAPAATQRNVRSATNGSQARAAAVDAGRTIRREGQRRRPDLGDHQRAHRHRVGSGDREGHDRHQGQPHRGGRRERGGAVGREVVDAAGATCIPGMIDASTDIGLNEPGVRNYDDVSEMLPFNQMLRTRVAYKSDSDAIPVARVEGHHDDRRAAGRRHDRRRDPGDGPRRLDVGGSTLRPTAGLAFNYPGGGGGGRGGGGGGRGAAPRRRARSAQDAESAARAGARLREAARDHGRSTGRSSRSCRSSTVVRRCIVTADTEQAHPRRGRVGRRAERPHRASDRRRRAARRRASSRSTTCR